MTFLNAALVVAIASLLLVGVVSQTSIRHVIQVAPMVVLLVLHPARYKWVPFGAMAVFAFWLFIMGLIWLFLLDLAHVVTGHFSRTEIALTVVIGVASAAGLVAAVRVAERPTWTVRLLTLAVAGAVQVGVMWLSLQPRFATR